MYIPFNLFPSGGQIGRILVEEVSLCTKTVLYKVGVPVEFTDVKIKFLLIFRT